MKTEPVSYRIILLSILLIAAALRLGGNDWDAYRHYHPDERYIAWVATTIEFTGHEQWSDVWSPQRSRFNPFYWPAEPTTTSVTVLTDEPRQFAYGHLPLYLGVLATRGAEWVAMSPRLSFLSQLTGIANLWETTAQIEFRYLVGVARALTAVVDVLTVGFLFLIGRRWFTPEIGLTAAAFLAVNVMHIQLSHFFAVDPYLTLFVVWAIYLMGASLTEKTIGSGRILPLSLSGAAVVVGLAVGSKFSAILLGLPLLVTALFLGRRRILFRLIAIFFVFAISFFLTNPFAVLDNGCVDRAPIIALDQIGVGGAMTNCYLQNILRQNQMVSGSAQFPFTRQYEGTAPFLYPLEMQIRWGMGPVLGVVAVMSTVWWLIWFIWRLRIWRRSEESLPPHWRVLIIIALWCIPYFLSNGSFYVKFMRYLMPVMPFGALFAAWALWHVRWPRWRWPIIGTIWGITAIYAVGFYAIYQQPHPWMVASEWIYEQAPAGATVVNELWDEPLPSSMTIDGQRFSRRQYNLVEVNWLSGNGPADSEAKLTRNLSQLASGDYLTIASNRNYGVVPRQPAAYPLSHQAYEHLLNGDLGYEIVFVIDRTPRLGVWHFLPDTFRWAAVSQPEPVTQYFAQRSQWLRGRADESFTVYDQPLTLILQNTGRLTVTEMMTIISATPE